MVSSMPAVPAMHEQVNQRAGQESEVREHTQNVSAMFCPDKERRDHQ
jgi:hypothetical protein